MPFKNCTALALPSFLATKLLKILIAEKVFNKFFLSILIFFFFVVLCDAKNNSSHLLLTQVTLRLSTQNYKSFYLYKHDAFWYKVYPLLHAVTVSSPTCSLNTSEGDSPTSTQTQWDQWDFRTCINNETLMQRKVLRYTHGMGNKTHLSSR